jgi:hypothetical protein
LLGIENDIYETQRQKSKYEKRKGNKFLKDAIESRDDGKNIKNVERFLF